MTPNQAIEVYVEQAASGLTNGILGYWKVTTSALLQKAKPYVWDMQRLLLI